MQKVCFVVMGFGKKTDYESGRTLDLDATYAAIIEPTVSNLGLRCVRADDVMHSGIIDTPMYEMLLRADLVIADISTGNVNAIYELGVRHALRPFSTIIMKEETGKLHFDLNHINTFQYKHLGEDIGVREATRARHQLTQLIQRVMGGSSIDSPVYTYLPKLQHPRLDDTEFAMLLDEAEAKEEKLSAYIRIGEQALRESRHADAASAFGAAAAMKPDEPFIIQQYALSTYKSEQPSPLEALLKGLDILKVLEPEQSNDPETLGISGAIHKRLWMQTGDRSQLELAIGLYSRGFILRRDYYTGENLATCYSHRANLQTDDHERSFDQMLAKKTRLEIIKILREISTSQTFNDRSDRKWVYATLANCLYALNKTADAEINELAFLAEQPAEWEIKTYHDGKAAAIAAAAV